MIAMKRLAAALTVAALALQPSLAAAQSASCITEKEVSGMAIYAVPSLIVSMDARCAAALSPRGFYARNGASISKRYLAHQDRAWPSAKSAIFKLGRISISEHTDHLDLISRLPDDSLRPLVDVMVAEMIADKLAQRDCRKVERMLEVLAPIEPDVAGALLAVLMTFTKDEKMPICPVEPA